MDVTEKLPFAEGYFDAVFCMNSLSFYGGSVGFLRHLLKHLKRGGILSVGSECFNAEFTPEECQNPPAVFSWPHPTGGNVWDGDFAKQHSPPWWRDLFTDSGLLEVLACRELEDGLILFEDGVRYNIEHGIDLEDARRSIDQLEYGREHSPHQTLFVIAARKL
jgi:SAM-dependent methyltransferase